MPSRNETIDVLKGVLIIFVIIGHALLGSLDENGLRYLIYSFHMPLFIFISGYLINPTKLLQSKPSRILFKYWHRMGWEWLIALLVYSAYLCIVNDISTKFLLKCLILPYYHLWYVPVLMIMISVALLTEHLTKSKECCLLYYLVLSLFLFGIYSYSVTNPISLTEVIGHYRLQYFLFFFLGILCRDIKIAARKYKNSVVTIGVCVFLCIILMFYLFGIRFSEYQRYFMLPMNTALCAGIVLPLICWDRLKSKVFSYIGQNSLHFYLWHVVPIIALKHFIGNPMIYYFVVSLGIILVLIIIKCTIYNEKPPSISNC